MGSHGSGEGVEGRLDAAEFRRRYERSYLWFGALFVTSLVLTNIIGVKLFYAFPALFEEFGWAAITLTTGILTYPVTFLVTDVVSEIWGKRRADLLVVAGFGMSLFMLAIVQLAQWVPPSAVWTTTPPRAIAQTTCTSEFEASRFVEVGRALEAAGTQEWDDAPGVTKDAYAFFTSGGELGTVHGVLERLPGDSAKARLHLADGSSSPDAHGAAAMILIPLGLQPGPLERGFAAVHGSAQKQLAFTDVFYYPGLLLFSSMLAYLVAQLFDVRLYHFWKRVTKGKHLWIRNNGSTLISQLVDTIIVNSIFLTIGLQLPAEVVIQVIVASYLFKGVLAALDTPFIYLSIWLVKRRLGYDWEQDVPVPENA